MSVVSQYRWFIVVAFMVFYPLLVMGQVPFTVRGRIIDADTKAPLAFVNIIINDSKRGGTTDIDGKFFFSSPSEIHTLHMSYVGYQDTLYQVPDSGRGDLIIELKKKLVVLEEVVIYPEVNPAHRIIDLVVANRDKNDPEQLKSFSYTSYDKMIFTVVLDTLELADSLKNDSSYIEVREFFDKQDIGLMETVTERKFMHPDMNYEKVTANRVSGFKDPIFVFLISQLQSTTFYDDLFHIMDKHYVNPISKGSTAKYFFLIEDTTYTELNDTVFVISYRPRRNTNFDGLEGVLYINSRGWAIQNVIAKPFIEEGFGIRIQQKYDLVDSSRWFPEQLNSDIIFNNAMIQSGETAMKIVAIGKSYIRNIELNPELVRRQFDVLGIDVEPNSHKKSEEFWNTYRTDSLSERDLNTYAFLDSIGEAENFDRFAKTMETIISGRIPWKFIDIDIDKFVKYDSYQGFYLGLGIHSNAVLSKRFNIGGYFGYGFKAPKFKYGLDASYVANRRKELTLMVDYFNDLEESGGTMLMFEKNELFSGQGWRQLLITRMNPTESIGAGLSMRILRDLKMGMVLASMSKDAVYDYRFGQSEDGVAIMTGKFNFTEVRLGFRFSFREEFIVTKRSRISLGSQYPVVWFQYTRGLDGFLNGAYAYDRFDLKVEESFYFKYLGRFSFILRGGLILGDVPFPNLYNGHGSYRVFTIFAPFSFSTMRMNEFMSDRYLSLYFTHNFGSLLFKKGKFQPELAISTNLGFGSFEGAPDKHYNITYRTMELGYYESGLMIHNILNLNFFNIGLGAFYRYGPYSLEKTGDNFAYKFSINFPFRR